MSSVGVVVRILDFELSDSVLNLWNINLKNFANLFQTFFSCQHSEYSCAYSRNYYYKFT